ncbi:hypothetical protein KTI87_02970 [Acinetobacter nosocomialis]|nr:hypothetical protein [Acinetobacter nosocomialis]
MIRVFNCAAILIFSINVCAKPVKEMTIEEKCEVFREVSGTYLDNYFNGQTREQQHAFIDQHAGDPDSAELIKRQIDGIYDHIALIISLRERELYKVSYSSMIYGGCIESQKNTK